MLSQLVYVSTREENCTEEEINKILSSCKKNNGDMDITGVLLYSDKMFVQYLEGDQKKIKSLYDKIKEDNRHSNVVMIANSPIQERHFPSWQMGSKKIDDRYELHSELSLKEQSEFKEILSGKGKEGTRALTLMKKFFN